MELILLKDVEKVGLKGDVVRVKAGFGRNFLLPRHLAVPASEFTVEHVEAQRARVADRKAKEKASAQERAAELSKVSLTIEAKAGEAGKLFGSVTTDEIRQALADKGYQFDKKQIHTKEAIRALGKHPVQIELYSQVKATVVVEVVPKS